MGDISFMPADSICLLERNAITLNRLNIHNRGMSMVVSMAAKCRNHQCCRTMIVSEGREVPLHTVQSMSLNSNSVAYLAHYAICPHCGLGQVFREADLRPLAS